MFLHFLLSMSGGGLLRFGVYWDEGLSEYCLAIKKFWGVMSITYLYR